MRLKRASLSLTFLVAANCSITLLTLATPIPALNVPRITEAAKLIVVGYVGTFHESGTTEVTIEGDGAIPARIMTAEIQVVSVIKGTLPAVQVPRFQLLLPQRPIGFGTVPPQTYRMLFLREDDEGRLTAASPYYPSLPGVPGEIEGGAPLDSVVRELAAVTSGGSTTREWKLEAIHALGTIDTESATAALTATLSDQDDLLRLTGAAMLLKRDDLRALNVAAPYLLKAGLSENLLQNLTSSIYLGVKNPDAVPILGRLQASPSVKVRRAVTFALRNTSSPDAIPPLLKALEDSDAEVRYYAAVGMAEITGQNEWRPSEEEFKADEQRYIRHWREWFARGAN